jgi:hypothetical protein
MLSRSNQVVVSILSAPVIILADISSSEVGYVGYASKEISNCPKKNSVNQATVQSASQVAIGNNIHQIIIQNGDQKGNAGNTNNNNCKHNHNGGGNSYGHHNSNNNSNNAPSNDNNNNQYLVQNAVEGVMFDNMN